MLEPLLVHQAAACWLQLWVLRNRADCLCSASAEVDTPCNPTSHHGPSSREKLALCFWNLDRRRLGKSVGGQSTVGPPAWPLGGPSGPAGTDPGSRRLRASAMLLSVWSMRVICAGTGLMYQHPWRSLKIIYYVIMFYIEVQSVYGGDQCLVWSLQGSPLSKVP